MSIYKNLSIGKKTILGFGALLAVFLIAIGTILVESFALRATMETVKHETVMLNLAKDVEIHVLGVMTYFGEVAASTDEATLQEAVAAIDAHREAYGKDMAGLTARIQTSATRARVAAVSDSVAALRSPNDRVLEHARAGRRAEAARVFAKESIPAIIAWQKHCSDLTGGLQQKFDQATDSAEGAIRTELTTITLAAVVATLVAILLGVLLSRSITRPIHAFMDALKLFSEADFTVKVDVESTDEIGQLGETLNMTIQHLRATIHEVSDAAQAVSSGAIQLSATSDEMARATHEIARGSETIHVATDSVAAAILQFQTSLEQVENNVKISIQNTAESVEAADAGILATEIVEERMARIRDAASRIAKAVSVIREIASQTNLLSLNAAIEAAKAGQQGKGFSVVAEEVRKLAERSRQATLEIAALIEETHSAVQDGSASTHDTVQQIQGIHDSVANVSSQIRQIGNATHEQAGTAGEISQRIEETSREVGQNAAASHELSATVEQVSRTAADLASVSERLSMTISKFRL